MAKLYAQEKRVFDINKMTVVGSPTISDDGVASGFDYTNNNYLKILDSQLQNSDNWEIKLKFTTGGIKTQYLISADRNDVEFSLGIWSDNNTTGYLFCWLTPSIHYNVPTSELTIEANTTYYVRYVVTNGIFTVDVSYDDITYKTCLTKTLPSSLTKSPQVIGIGNNANRNFAGSIDLTAFKIYVDGELVYSPTKPICYLERRKEGFDLSKFTVVGSPTITEDGVASGFSGSDYITTPQIVNITNTSVLKLVGRFKISTLSSNQVLISLNNAMGNDTNTSKITLRFNTNGTSTGFITNANANQVANLSSSNIKVQANTEYDFSFKLDGLSYEFKVGDSTLSGTLYDYFTEGLYMVSVGKAMYVSHSYWLGSIDLSQFSITVDGKEVFTGAKEKFYAMEGGF